MKYAEQLARDFHDIYEEKAPEFGYEIREETREFDPTTPKTQLMIAVCREIIDRHTPDLTVASKKLYNFYWDCGSSGELDGLFIATEDDVKSLIGKEIHFGEILGKHSDIHGILGEDDFAVMSTDSALIEDLQRTFQSDTLCGYNPLDSQWWE